MDVYQVTYTHIKAIWLDSRKRTLGSKLKYISTQSFLFDLCLFPTKHCECIWSLSARLICLSCHSSSVCVSMWVWYTYDGLGAYTHAHTHAYIVKAWALEPWKGQKGLMQKVQQQRFPNKTNNYI